MTDQYRLIGSHGWGLWFMHDAKSLADLATLEDCFEKISRSLDEGRSSALTPKQRARALLSISRALREMSTRYRENALRTRSRSQEIREKTIPRRNGIETQAE